MNRPLNDNYVNSLVNKWAYFLKDVKDPANKKNLAVIYENTINYYKRELMEDSPTATSQNAAPFIKHLFPILRQLFPNMITPEIVSVQPMTAPVGAVFFYKYIYASNKGETALGDEAIKKLDTTFSSENVKNEFIATGDGSHSSYTHTAGWLPVRPKSDEGYIVKVFEVNSSGVVVQELTDDGSGGFTGDGTGTIDYDTGAISVTFTANVGNGNKVLCDYWYVQEANTNIPKFKFELTLKEIKAIRRSLNLNWTAEISADLKALQGLDAESELTQGASSELALEYDRWILDLIRANVPTNHIASWSATVPAGIPDYQHYRSIITAIGDVAHRILTDTKRMRANWIVVGSKVANLLDQLSTHGDFRPMVSIADVTPYGNADYIARPNSVGTISSDMGIMKIGTLGNKYWVYLNPYMPENEVLIGLKMDRLFDAGFIWSPYQPLVITPTFYDPNDMTMKKAMMSRNGHYMARPEFYGKLVVNNLPY
jgi:hypothetical protein